MREVSSFGRNFREFPLLSEIWMRQLRRSGDEEDRP